MKKTLSAIFTTILLYGCDKPCIESRGIEGAGLTITFFQLFAFNFTTNNTRPIRQKAEVTSWAGPVVSFWFLVIINIT